MSPRPDPALPRALARSAYDAAMRFHDLRLWESFDDMRNFAVRVDGVEGPVLVVVLGAAGSEFGLGFYWGPAAVDALFAAQGGDYEFTSSRESWLGSITVSAVRAIPEYLRDVLQAAGRSGRLGPAFLVKPSGRHSRSARKNELRWMVRLLETVGAAVAAGQFTAQPRVDHARSLRLPVYELGADDALHVTWENFDEQGPQGLFDGPTEVADLPQGDATWWVGRRRMPTEVEGYDREVDAFLVVDGSRDKVLRARLLFAGELERAFVELWATMLDGSKEHAPGRPAKLVVTDRDLFDALQVPLSTTGIASEYAADLPAFDAVARDLADHLSGLHEEPDDEEASDLLLEISDAFRRSLPGDDHSRSALGAAGELEFFGAEQWEDGDDDDIRDIAQLHWALLDGSSRTPAMRHRAGEISLAPREASLLEVLSAARLTIHRFRMRGGSGELLDLLDPDDPERLIARLPSVPGQEIFDGALWIGRSFEFGGSRQFMPSAPFVPAAFADRALSFLREQGMELDHEGVRRDARLFGRLFDFLGGLAGRGLALTNTDGDPLDLLTATFRVGSVVALRKAFEGRADVDDGDGGDDTWTWFRSEPGSEQRTLLARLQLLGDELLVELNSVNRLAAIRRWLEPIDGVEFVRSRSAEGPTPVDDALPRPGSRELDPESLAMIQEMIRQQMLGWVDEKVPVLGGLTPREAVKDPELRKQVELLIRTMPDPGGIPGLVAPRDEIRQILGL